MIMDIETLHNNLQCRHCNTKMEKKQHAYTLSTGTGDEDMKLNAFVCGKCGYTEFVNARIAKAETENYSKARETVQSAGTGRSNP
jgi:predicted nucleic-acid-binding Zn-ribbon protein